MLATFYCTRCHLSLDLDRGYLREAYRSHALECPARPKATTPSWDDWASVLALSLFSAAILLLTLVL